MRRCVCPVLCLPVLLACGCVTKQMWQEFLGEPASTSLVPPGGGDEAPARPAPPPARVSFAPASGETALRVDALGRKILAANPQTGLQPLFVTIGAPQPEVFHRGPQELDITEGLVKQCQTEGQLAAVLALEMGRMVSEREALASARARNPDRGPPPEVPIGNAGSFSGADQVRAAELAKYSPRRPRYERPLPPPDPKLLARLYLKKAGYAEADLDAAAPLLDAARQNFGLEKQLKAAGPNPVWKPAGKEPGKG